MAAKMNNRNWVVCVYDKARIVVASFEESKERSAFVEGFSLGSQDDHGLCFSWPEQREDLCELGPALEQAARVRIAGATAVEGRRIP